MEWWNYLIAGVAALVGFILKWLLDKYSNNMVQAALTFLNGAIPEAVYAVNQIYVDAIKAASEDGLLTDEEKKYAKQLCWDHIMAKIPPLFLAALQKLFATPGALNTHIDDGIEAAVKAAKIDSL